MTESQPQAMASSSIDAAEVGRFAALAQEWWDPEGKFKPLHRFNPARLDYARRRLAAHFGRMLTADSPFEGLSLVDIGCGGGLMAEPMARAGFAVTGIDAAADGIPVAAAHARAGGLAVDYRQATAEQLVAEGRQFDAVMALEVIEHVADPAAFVRSVAALARPGGALVLGTLNRTPKSFALGVVAAEYLLRWVPRGTHAWSKFLKPSEVANFLRPTGLTLRDISGVHYDIGSDRWSTGGTPDVNYLMFATAEE